MYTHNQARYEFQQNLKTVAQSAQSKRPRFPANQLSCRVLELFTSIGYAMTVDTGYICEIKLSQMILGTQNT